MENKKTIEISGARILGLLTLITCLISLFGMAVTTPDSNSHTSFWALIILFGIPALFYIIFCTRSVIRGGIKYLVFTNKKVSKELPVKPEVDEAEVEKQKIKDKELKRKQKENYSSSKLKTRWTIMPILMLIGSGIYMAIVYFSNGKEYTFDGFNMAVAIIGGLGLLSIWGISIQDEWEKRLSIKQEIHQENQEYEFYTNYDDDLVYLDTKFEYLFFRLTKVLAYLSGIAGLAVLVGLIISLISNISITPTTIIIFLLILIYLEVSKRNRE